MKTETWILICGAAVALVLALILVRVIFAWNERRRGVDGINRTGRLLRRFAGIRRFQVLSGLSLPLRGKAVKIDHILIGFFGIMLVTVRNAKGTVYGGGRDKNWVQVVTKHEQEKRGTFPNPIPENQEALEAVRQVLLDNKVYKIPIENYIVFANKKAVLNIERGLPVMTFSQFKKLLKRAKYSDDGNTDVEQIAKLLTEAAR